MLWICLSMLLVSYVIALPLCLFLVRAGRYFGLVDRAGEEAHKPGGRTVPNTGGMAVFWAVLGPMIAGLLMVWLLPTGWWAQVFPPIVRHLPGLRQSTGMGGGIVAAIGAVHLLGIIDDREPVAWWVKLAVQLVIAGFLVLACQMRVLMLLDDWGWAGFLASVAASTLWIVCITNAFNFLDNMDGLSAGVAAIVAGLYLASTLIAGQWFVAALTALLLGALLAFLALNFPPARLFLGDGGSLVIGMLLAVISIRTTYFGSDLWGMTDLRPPVNSLAQGLTGSPGRWYTVMMPLMVMAIPLYDFLSVTIIRLRAGRSIFSGDHNHFSHRLVRKGLTRRTAVMVIWLATLATGLSGVMLGSLQGWQAAISAAQTLAVLGIIVVLERGVPGWGDRKD